MAAICPTTEAALQAGLLPAQERREGRFAKVSGRLKKVSSDGLILFSKPKVKQRSRRRSDSRIRRLFAEQVFRSWENVGYEYPTYNALGRLNKKRRPDWLRQNKSQSYAWYTNAV